MDQQASDDAWAAKALAFWLKELHERAAQAFEGFADELRDDGDE